MIGDIEMGSFTGNLTIHDSDGSGSGRPGHPDSQRLRWND